MSPRRRVALLGRLPRYTLAENVFHAEGDLEGVSERVDLIDG